ncbi:MAG: amidohydrolase family protein [Alphaproteobacteria bacterium]|nr:amidohydrolase family protein [Alphaproteobacteria bacterium]
MPATNRRDLLALMGAAALAGNTAPAFAASTPVIEWNMHMFSADTAKFPFHPSAVYKPDASKFPVDPLPPYQAHLKEAGIDKAMFVQPEPYGDDHSLVLDCLRRTSGDKFKGTSLFYPKNPESPKKLAALVKNQPRIVSTRFHAHRGKEMYLDSFAADYVRALWRRAVELGLVIELHIGPNYALQAADAIRAFPGCKVLIDHMDEPKLGNPYEYANVLDLAKLPNVYMKLSGLDYIASDAPYFESLRPFTSRLIKEYGADRVVWSGGSPKIADAHMKGYSAADIAKVKGGNLQRLLNW